MCSGTSGKISFKSQKFSFAYFAHSDKECRVVHRKHQTLKFLLIVNTGEDCGRTVEYVNANKHGTSSSCPSGVTQEPKKTFCSLVAVKKRQSDFGVFSSDTQSGCISSCHFGFILEQMAS